jgi:hypothetical protein
VRYANLLQADVLKTSPTEASDPPSDVQTATTHELGQPVDEDMVILAGDKRTWKTPTPCHDCASAETATLWAWEYHNRNRKCSRIWESAG